MKKMACLGLALAAIALTGCKTRITDFTVLSTKNVDLSNMASFTQGTQRVTGEDLYWMILVFPTGIPNLKEAIDRAIEQMPGCVALVDGVIYNYGAFYVLAGQMGFIVEGTPLIDPKLSKLRAGVEPKSNCMVVYQDPVTSASKSIYLSTQSMSEFRLALRAHDQSAMNRILAEKAL